MRTFSYVGILLISSLIALGESSEKSVDARVFVIPKPILDQSAEGKALLERLKSTETKRLTKEQLAKMGISTKNNELAWEMVMTGATEDGPELVCYRCCFKKISKDHCGTYRDIYGNADWAPNCPKHRP